MGVQYILERRHQPLIGCIAMQNDNKGAFANEYDKRKGKITLFHCRQRKLGSGMLIDMSFRIFFFVGEHRQGKLAGKGS